MNHSLEDESAYQRDIEKNQAELRQMIEQEFDNCELDDDEEQFHHQVNHFEREPSLGNSVCSNLSFELRSSMIQIQPDLPDEVSHVLDINPELIFPSYSIDSTMGITQIKQKSSIAHSPPVKEVKQPVSLSPKPQKSLILPRCHSVSELPLDDKENTAPLDMNQPKDYVGLDNECLATLCRNQRNWINDVRKEMDVQTEKYHKDLRMLNHKYALLESEKQYLNGELCSYKNQVKTLTFSLEQFRNQVLELNTKINGLSVDKNQLLCDLEYARAENDELQQQLINLSQSDVIRKMRDFHSSELAKEQTQASKQISALRSQLDTKEALIADRERTVKKLESENSLFHGEISKMSDQIKILQSEKASLVSDLKASLGNNLPSDYQHRLGISASNDTEFQTPLPQVSGRIHQDAGAASTPKAFSDSSKVVFLEAEIESLRQALDLAETQHDGKVREIQADYEDKLKTLQSHHDQDLLSAVQNATESAQKQLEVRANVATVTRSVVRDAVQLCMRRAAADQEYLLRKIDAMSASLARAKRRVCELSVLMVASKTKQQRVQKHFQASRPRSVASACQTTTTTPGVQSSATQNSVPAIKPGIVATGGGSTQKHPSQDQTLAFKKMRELFLLAINQIKADFARHEKATAEVNEQKLKGERKHIQQVMRARYLHCLHQILTGQPESDAQSEQLTPEAAVQWKTDYLSSCLAQPISSSAAQTSSSSCVSMNTIRSPHPTSTIPSSITPQSLQNS